MDPMGIINYVGIYSYTVIHYYIYIIYIHYTYIPIAVLKNFFVQGRTSRLMVAPWHHGRSPHHGMIWG